MGDPGGVNYPLFCANICVWDKHIPPGSIPQPSTLRFALNYTWEQGREPLHWDIDPTKTNGVGPGMAFADHLLAKASENLDCSRISEWIKGTGRYTSLIRRINASLESGGRLQGFVWFQGESDAALEVESQVYHKNLINFFKDLRDDLNQPTLPILLVKIANHDLNISPFISYVEDVRKAEEAVDHELLDVTTVDAKKAVQHVLNSAKNLIITMDISVYTLR
ncbi:hypothetical protein CSA_004472 [Cucumis sativus]|uniref:Uncharacterized protein n=1 Tax=Cucumis sativus TaxID=3659 RepID=A0ACB6HBW7_CUCSA|nr:hypothetical protein CSA_004472 [Cucumis sativus]